MDIGKQDVFPFGLTNSRNGVYRIHRQVVVAVLGAGGDDLHIQKHQPVCAVIDDQDNGSNLATLYPNVKAIRENFISKIVLSNTEAEFEQYYQELITESKKAGSDEMIQIMLPLLHEQLKLRDPDGTFFK